MNYEVIHAPDGQKNILYKALRMCFKALNLKKLLIGTKEEVLARAAKLNARNPFVLPADKKRIIPMPSLSVAKSSFLNPIERSCSSQNEITMERILIENETPDQKKDRPFP